MFPLGFVSHINDIFLASMFKDQVKKNISLSITNIQFLSSQPPPLKFYMGIFFLFSFFIIFLLLY